MHDSLPHQLRLPRQHAVSESSHWVFLSCIFRGFLGEGGACMQDQKRELASGAFDRRRPEQQQASRLANVRLLMDV